MSVELEGDILALHEYVRARFELAKKAHDTYRPRWEHWFGLYRGYNEMKDNLRRGSENDRDVVLRDAQKVYGTELFIPYSFATVETILPRALSNRPRMLILPDGEASKENVEKMKQLIDRQQEQIAYELKLQETAKSGFIYGLGVQKTCWRKETRMTRQLIPMEVPTEGAEWQASEPMQKVVFDDPDVEDVDIFDFFWDPFAANVAQCRYLIHRTWRDTPYVLDRLLSGEWSNPAGLTLEDIEQIGPSSKFADSVQNRARLSGLPDYSTQDADIHEIWEFHDHDGRIVTVLDGQVPVHEQENPYWHGEFPFQIFRPTTAGFKQIPGIGEVEPIEQLQQEVNQLRSQRRDNAALKLMQVFAFHDGFVNKNDLQFYPGAAIPVSGDPREMLLPVQVGDIPNSGYQEEGMLQADIERTTGISDPVSGVGDASQTATGVQLVQAAANVRIANKTRRIEVELCAPAARQWVSLNQQMILTRKLPIPTEPTPMEPAAKWKVIELTPAELQGDFVILPEGGAVAPDNEAQQRADAAFMIQTFRLDPNIDQRKLYREVLELLGYRNAEAFLAPAQYIPPIVFDILSQDFGVPIEMLQEALEMGLQFEDAQRDGAVPEGAPPGPDEQAPPPSGG